MKKRFILILLALMCLVPSVSLAAESPAAEVKNKALLESQGSVAYIPARALNGFSGIGVIWSASSKRVAFNRGASSGLYYNGKYLTTPGRKISNALIVTLQ